MVFLESEFLGQIISVFHRVVLIEKWVWWWETKMIMLFDLLILIYFYLECFIHLSKKAFLKSISWSSNANAERSQWAGSAKSCNKALFKIDLPLFSSLILSVSVLTGTKITQNDLQGFMQERSWEYVCMICFHSSFSSTIKMGKKKKILKNPYVMNDTDLSSWSQEIISFHFEVKVADASCFPVFIHNATSMASPPHWFLLSVCRLGKVTRYLCRLWFASENIILQD